MNTFMLLIIPEIIESFEKHNVCDSEKAIQAIKEHANIYEAIKTQNPELAKQMMKIHFKVLYQYCYPNQEEFNS